MVKLTKLAQLCWVTNRNASAFLCAQKPKVSDISLPRKMQGEKKVSPVRTKVRMVGRY